MKIIIHTIVFVFFASILVSQNNGIFYGGNGDGHDAAMYSSDLNNTIFYGNIGDGYSSSYSQPVLNNSIFNGRNGDGYDVNNYIQSISNSIFTGDKGDGYSSYSIKPTINNSIYAGGNGDGFDQDFIASFLNNSIYIGSTGDGYATMEIRSEVNNGIYAGGKADGYDASNISKILWEGSVNSEWNLAANWNINRVPQLDDYVEIRNGKLNYPSLDQPSFKINEAGIYNYICGSIMIHDLASITTGMNVFIINSGKIYINGIWQAMNTNANSFINEHGGEILIRTGGLLEIKN